MNTDFLRRLPLFEGLSGPDLDRLQEMAEPVTVEAGVILMAEGSPGEAMYVALDGTFEVTKRSGEQEMVIAGCGAGDVIGEISLLERSPRSATVRALSRSHLLRISQATFDQLLAWSPSAALSILRTVTARLRNTEVMLRQSEKMAALGTLSAGLAHELNNPAAAVQRGAGLLREALAGWLRLSAELSRLQLDPAQLEVVNSARDDIVRRAGQVASIDPLGRGDRESELEEWLEAYGADNAWELAPALVALSWDTPALAKLVAGFSPEQVAPFVRWLGAGCLAYILLGEVNEGAERIAEIVRSVKAYSYLDQAPVQLVDVHEGLESTLVILRHKLKQGITIRRDYGTGLPRIEAYASELNQVWTNLIDNAVDAMDGKGEIVLRTRLNEASHGARVVVEISDNGPGIPPEILPRIFDVFFTTKPPGQGTGLGLHISYNIVVHKHRGEMTVNTRVGETTFRVALPVQLDRDQGAPIQAGSRDREPA